MCGPPFRVRIQNFAGESVCRGWGPRCQEPSEKQKWKKPSCASDHPSIDRTTECPLLLYPNILKQPEFGVFPLRASEFATKNGFKDTTISNLDKKQHRPNCDGRRWKRVFSFWWLWKRATFSKTFWNMCAFRSIRKLRSRSSFRVVCKWNLFSLSFFLPFFQRFRWAHVKNVQAVSETDLVYLETERTSGGLIFR